MSKSPHPSFKAVALTLSVMTAAFSLPIGILLLALWVPGPTPLVAEGSRWIYAPTTIFLLLGSIASFLAAGAERRRTKPQQTRLAMALIASSLLALALVASGPMRAQVLQITFHNDSEETLGRVAVEISGSTHQIKKMPPEHQRVWATIVDEGWGIDILVETPSGEYLLTESQSESSRRELAIHFTSDQEILLER